MPLLDWAPVGVPAAPEPGAGVLPPKARLARLAPMAIVRMSLPSLKPTSAMPIVGSWREIGPSWIGPPAGLPPGAAASIVKVEERPARLTVGVGVFVVRKVAARNVIVTAPGTNRSTVFFVSLSFRK